jgi:transposase
MPRAFYEKRLLKLRFFLKGKSVDEVAKHFNKAEGTIRREAPQTRD